MADRGEAAVLSHATVAQCGVPTVDSPRRHGAQWNAVIRATSPSLELAYQFVKLALLRVGVFTGDEAAEEEEVKLLFLTMREPLKGSLRTHHRRADQLVRGWYRQKGGNPTQSNWTRTAKRPRRFATCAFAYSAALTPLA
jgi:hypothetical protein